MYVSAIWGTYMKKVIATIMAAAVMLSQLSLLVKATDGNPLAVSNRVTADINELRQREEDIKNQRAAQKAASRALINYGKTTGKTNDLSFYINRKNLTKREFEAFKWSFIFSQFAHPLEDSLLNVFDQDFFQELSKADLDIDSVRTTILNSGLVADSDDIKASSMDTDLQAMMLQDVNFNELAEVIKSNYAIYPLVDSNGTPASLDSFISGDLGLYEPFFIYDTHGTADSVNELNALLYSKDKLTDLDKNYGDKWTLTGFTTDDSAEPYKVPVLFYDSNTFLAMQMAMTIYMTNNDYSSLTEAVAFLGAQTLAVDSYGNICLQKQSGDAVIFIPNFYNTVLTSVLCEIDGGEKTKQALRETMDLFNVWFVALYSKNTRTRTTIYPAVYTTHVNGSTSKIVNPDTGEIEEKATEVLADHYAQLIGGTSHSLSRKFLLVENSIISPGEQQTQAVVDSAIDNKDDETALAFSHAAKMIAEKTLSEYIDSWFPGNMSSRPKSDASNVGTLVSPYNTHASAFMPFTANDSSKPTYFENKYPLAQAQVAFKEKDVISSDAASATNFSRFAAILENAKWKYILSPRRGSYSTHSIQSSMHAAYNDSSNMMAINPTVSLMTSLPAEQLIPDLRFVSAKKSEQSTGARTVIFLPKEILDLGQTMSAYTLSDEKGMFLSQYEVYFSGDIERFREYMLGTYNQVLGTDSGRFLTVDYDSGVLKVKSLATFNRTYLTEDTEFTLSWSTNKYTSTDFFDYVHYSIKDEYKSGHYNEGARYVYEVLKEKKDEDGNTYYENYDPPKYTVSSDEKSGDKYSFIAAYYYDSDIIDPGISTGSCSEIPTPDYKLKNDSADAKMKAGAQALWAAGAAIAGMSKDAEYGSTEGFQKLLADVCASCGFNTDEFYYMLVNIYRFNGKDNGTFGINSVYFYDEYTCLLRNGATAFSDIDCENSDDFVQTTYYWDRYYLTKQQLSQDVSDYVNKQYESIDSLVSDYENYLNQTFQTSLQYSFSRYLQDYKSTATLPPFANEYALQVQSLAEWKTKNPAVSKLLQSKQASLVYEYLADDTIILYPFGWDDYYYDLHLYAGAGDTIYQHSASGEANTEQINVARTKTSVNLIQTLLALQKNTDYQHNNLKTTYTQRIDENHVTREELMDKANQFFDSPVSGLSYILTGFLYQIHESVATGDFGSIFNISYLTETDAYKWIMDRYIALVTIAIAIVLFLKLIQFAMNKSKDFAHIGRSILGILAMCMVPVVVFNSFVWAFDVSSDWAMKSTSDKILLAQINRYCSDANNDGNVTAEITAFKQQFSSVKGTYDCLQFEQMTNYSLGSGPVYSVVPISDMIANLQYSTSYDTWYSNKSFIPVHQDLYKDSYFYFFYDYIKQEFLKYSAEHDDGSSEVKQAGESFETNRKSLKAGSADDIAKDINAAENLFRTSRGSFRRMLLDTDFVYKNSVHETQEARYGGPHATDLAGMYMIFDASAAGQVTKTLQDTVYFRAYTDADAMKVSNEGMISETWLNQNAISDYVEKQISLGKGIRGDPGKGSYAIYTSGLDPYEGTLNTNAYLTDATNTATAPIITPLEQALIDVTEKTYNQTMTALNYLPGQMHDEAAIVLMAYIATFNLNQAMGYEPQAPLTQSVTLDDVVSTAFLTDLDMIGTETNTLYAMIAQGDSVGKAAIVVILEIIICLSSIFRVLIILYITGASFVILMLRLLHKAPRTTELIYGIVGNVLALLFLHMLTLFLVVIAVEWVANATSAIPGLVLDVLMIAFSILVLFFLFRLIKNLVRDAINMGGSKIKAGVIKITDAISNITGNLKIPKSDMDVEIAEINAQQAETRKKLGEELKETYSLQQDRISAVIKRLNNAEATEAEKEAEQETRQHTKTQALSEAENRID